MITVPTPPDDMDIASDKFDAACGHGALAAVLGMSAASVMKYFSSGGGYVNIPMMKDAIRAAGRTLYRKQHEGQDLLPGPDEYAVMLIQFTGPWMKSGNPIAACRWRHWIAAAGNALVFDANHPGWQTHDYWQKEILPDLLPERGDKGWYFSAVLRIK